MHVYLCGQFWGYHEWFHMGGVSRAFGTILMAGFTHFESKILNMFIQRLPLLHHIPLQQPPAASALYLW